MTSALHVPRPSNSQGITSYVSSNSCKWTTFYGTPFSTTTTKSNGSYYKQVGFVDTPVNGVVVDGFRLPTAWFMVADRTYDYGSDYECKDGNSPYSRYYKKGDEFAFNPAARPGNSPYNLGSKTVSLPAGLSNSSNNKALNKIKNSKVDLGVAFGEANTTLSMLANSIKEFSEIIRDARKGRWDKLRKRFGTEKGLASSWLEFQYGWMPLLSDIYGLQQQLREGFRKEGFLIRASATSKYPWPVHEAFPKSHPTQITADLMGDGFYLSRTVYYCKIADAQLYALSQMGLINPLLIAWELTTLSFVIDWFIPLGDFLEGLTATVGTSFVAGFEDRIAYGKYEAIGTYRTYVKGRKGHVARHVYAFERRVLSTFSPPGLTWGNFLNTQRAISALALIVQRS